MYGINFEAKDSRIIALNGTSTSESILSFFKHNGKYDVDINDLGLKVGDVVNFKCYAIENIPSSSVGIRIYCMNGSNQILMKQIFPQSGLIKETEFAIPENTLTIQIAFFVVSGSSVNGRIFPCLTKKTDTIVDIIDGMVIDNNYSDFSVFPCIGNLTYGKNLQDYIDEHSGGVSPEDVYNLMTYVTPEQFGAKGDKWTDDTQSFKQCIEYAKQYKIPIKANKSYGLSEKIVIDFDYADFTANTLRFTGNDSYLEIDCMNSNFKIETINTDNIGAMFKGDKSRCIHNRFEVNTITSGRHGVVFWAKSKPVYQNEVRFMWIYGGNNNGDYALTSNLYDNESFVTENNIYGGHVNKVEWAWYGEGGTTKFYSIHCEGEVKGGFFFPSDSNCVILGDRHAEAARDGEHPFIKIGNGEITPTTYSLVGNQQIRFISPTSLPINEIDVSGNSISGIRESDGKLFSLPATGRGFIDTPISAGLVQTGSNENNTNALSQGAYTWGKKIILIPTFKCTRHINTDLDLRFNDANLKVLPTTFIIDNDCTINLHASYCFMGFNEFKIVQTNNNKAMVYDYDGNLVFNGQNESSGEYIISHEIISDDGIATYDGTGTEWFVTKSVTQNQLEQSLGDYIVTVAEKLGGDALR